MRLFLNILGWLFGIIFFIFSIPYFWCGEFFLGLWSLVVVVVLIPQLYKYISGKFKFGFSKIKAIVYSLIIFFLLFANFVRPLFPDYMAKTDIIKHLAEVGTDLSKELEIINFKSDDAPKIKCIKRRQAVIIGELALKKATKYLTEDKNIPNIYKLTYIPAFNFVILMHLKNNVEITKEKIKAECGDF